MSNPNTRPDQTKRPHSDWRPRRGQPDHPALGEACHQGAPHFVASLARQSRWSLALAPLLVVVLGAAGCGGGSSNNSGATSSGGTTTMSRAVQAAQCMRAHGVTNFPDPTTAGPGAKEGVDPNSPTFQAAWAACRQYFPPGAPTPAQSAQREADLLRFAQCMRSHGVPNFPDPNSQGDFNFTGTEINPDSPAVLAAGRTCLPTANGAVKPPSPTGQ